MLKKVIKEGEAMPQFYGLAYRDFARYEGVCYPIVINLIVRYLRVLYFLIANPPGSRSEYKEKEAFWQGYEAGLEAAEREKNGDIRNELERLLWTTAEKVTGDF